MPIISFHLLFNLHSNSHHSDVYPFLLPINTHVVLTPPRSGCDSIHLSSQKRPWNYLPFWVALTQKNPWEILRSKKMKFFNSDQTHVAFEGQGGLRPLVVLSCVRTIISRESLVIIVFQSTLVARSNLSVLTMIILLVFNQSISSFSWLILPHHHHHHRRRCLVRRKPTVIIIKMDHD